MNNPLSFVASTQLFDVEAFTSFALQHETKYKIFYDSGMYWVSNWSVEQLIRDFKVSPDFKEAPFRFHDVGARGSASMI